MNLNESAPDFELPDINRVLHRLSNYRGKIVIVNFWSCECPHSERTDQALMAMSVQWAENVVMLSIASNRSESPQSVEEAAKTRRLPIVLIDADHFGADLFEAQPRRTSSWLTGRDSFVIAARWTMLHSANGNLPASFWTKQWRLCSMGICPRWQRLRLMAAPSFERFDSCYAYCVTINQDLSCKCP